MNIMDMRVKHQLTTIIALLIDSMPKANDVEVGLAEELLHLLILTIEVLVVCDMLQLISQGPKLVLDGFEKARKSGKTLIFYVQT